MCRYKTVIAFLLLCVFAHEHATQKTYPSKVNYAASKLYEMRLDMEPTSVRVSGRSNLIFRYEKRQNVMRQIVL